METKELSPEYAEMAKKMEQMDAPPPPLAIPKVDPALAQKRKEEAEKRAAAAPKKPEVKELSMHEQLALVKLKKVDPKEEAASKLIIILLYT
jgi:hypothetical protein